MLHIFLTQTLRSSKKNNYRADFTEKGGRKIGFLEKYSGGEDKIGFLSSDSFSSGLPKT